MRPRPPTPRTIDGAPELRADDLDAPTSAERRRFLRLMAASLALAGAGGCSRTPPEEIVPHARGQRRFIPGVPQWYATSVTRSGRGMGALVRSDDGRPTKIEGNPDHPASLGATDAVMQAELLTLYDPARSGAVRHRGRISDWGSLERALADRAGALRERRGEGLRIVLGPVTSPSELALIGRVRERFPRAVWHCHDPLRPEKAVEGAEILFGRPLEPVIDLSEARAIVSLDHDLFAAHPAGVRWAREFAGTRRDSLERGALRPSLFVAEPAPTTSGARADERLPVRRSAVAAVAAALARELGVRAEGPPAPEAAARWTRRAAEALRGAGAGGVVIAGPAQPAGVHAVALAMNAALGSLHERISLIEPLNGLRSFAQPLDECFDALAADEVDALVLLGVNPVYDEPRRDVGELIARARFSVQLSLYADETSSACSWHAPLAHDLERWGDARAFDGVAGIIQPLTEPMRGGRTALWMLARLAGEDAGDRELVEAHWRARVGAAGWERWRREALRAGVVPGSRPPAQSAEPAAARLSVPSDPPGDGLELAISPDPRLLDGRHAANAWLQELPEPITQLTWTNAALLSPALAAAHRVRSGDVVRITAPDARVELPALLLPGVADGVVALAMGHGRSAGAAASTGEGVRIAPLQGVGRAWSRAGASLERTGLRVDLPIAQGHDDMAGREIVRVLEPGQRIEHGTKVHLPLYDSPPMRAPQQWGMSVDLAVCTGCSACVVACQAENNVPVVGPEEIRRGRRMHWLRVDRYHTSGEGEARTLFQPLACVHCEEAPCELVCPTGATQHSHDGLNEMNYARCIGTRYCSNNCPYKVRRFNFFRYADDPPSLQRMRNPRVTTRGRGVMEKCTYCVQRIRAAEIDSRARDELIPDGAVIPACAQACPTGAIVFGDIADRGTRVSHEKRSGRSYELLGELGVKPRTTYLADVRRSERGPA